MASFQRLRVISAFEKQYRHFFRTVQDHHLIAEIGYHQARGKPLTLKQLFLLDVGSIATVQRRLRRLKELGLVQHQRSPGDRRSVQLTLSVKCLRIVAKYDLLMSTNPSAQNGARGSAEPAHVCGLCDNDAGGRSLLATHLAQGLKHGDRCLLVASADTQRGILAELNHRRKTPAEVIVSEGHRSADSQLAFLKVTLHEAKLAGQAMCIAADMSWTFSKSLPFDAVLIIEAQFDALARQAPLTGLCVYDARHFSSGEFLHAVKCHRDHARHPILVC